MKINRLVQCSKKSNTYGDRNVDSSKEIIECLSGRVALRTRSSGRLGDLFEVASQTLESLDLVQSTS